MNVKRGARCAILAAALAMAGAAASDEAVVKVAEAVSSGIVNVKAGGGLTVDLTGYELAGNTGIIALQLYNDYYYHTVEPGRTVYRFSADDGQPVKGAGEFPGLAPGDPVFVLIGREAYPGSLNAGAMISSESILVKVE